MAKSEPTWLKTPEEQDYPAALSYLSIVYPTTKARQLVNQLKAAAVVEFKAKDIFRASKLSLLGISNSHVAKDQAKVKKGEALSPLLLVRGLNGKVIIADGYHRLCAVYTFNEDATIPCKIV